MKFLKTVAICFVILLLATGCVVTKKSYNQLLSELTAEKQQNEALDKDLLDTRTANDKTIAEQKNRITSLDREISDLNAKYEEDSASYAARQAELSRSIEVLRDQSSEETQNLLQQIVELQEKYDADMAAKTQTVSDLQSSHRIETEALNNRLDHEIQSNKLVLERLLKEIETLEALTAEREKAFKQLEAQTDQLEQELKDEIEKGEIRLKRYKSKTIINIDNSILFDSGRATLKKQIKTSLAKIADALINFPENNLQIEGHTDDVPIKTARYPSNWELSAARALAVLRFFSDDTDVDPRKLSAVGYGEYQPLVPNDTPENRKLNRRVDIVILPK